MSGRSNKLFSCIIYYARLSQIDFFCAFAGFWLILVAVALYAIMGVPPKSDIPQLLGLAAFAVLFLPWVARQDKMQLDAQRLLSVLGFGINKHILYYIPAGAVVSLIYVLLVEFIKYLAGPVFQFGIPVFSPEPSVVSTFIFAPVLEETLFRHLGFGVLAYCMIRMRVNPAIAITMAMIFSSVAFALFHDWKTPLGWIHIGLVSTIFAWVYWASGRNLLTSIAVHAVYNIFVVLI
jgi:membrane protease YdiL (CAAX protease family)